MSLKRDEIVYCVIWAVTCAGTGGALAVLWNTGFKSDDVFAFAGAIVGALGAVGGAAWIADRSADRERREEQSDIRDEIDYLKNNAGKSVCVFSDDGGHLPGWSEQIGSFYNELLHSSGFLHEVIAHAKTLSFRQRREIKLLAAKVKEYIEYYEKDDDMDVYDDRSHHSLLVDIMKQAIVAELAFGPRPLMMMGFGRSRL